jgi:hypothetical protein
MRTLVRLAQARCQEYDIQKTVCGDFIKVGIREAPSVYCGVQLVESDDFIALAHVVELAKYRARGVSGNS